uniref:MIF4G domain-containing protein n=1 Tax=Lepeophtheirus salmonis TaxID=72036 RepID=A0A0K2VAN6_LEPSM
MDQDMEDETKTKEDETKTKEDEIAILNEYLDDWKKKKEWKEGLRAQNTDCKSRPEENDLRKLDSSLKKNTAFIRKLKNYTDSQRPGICKEIKTLNLTKYIGEVTSALLEAKYKMNDLPGVVEVSSLLHQTYSDFSSSFLEAWTRILSFSKKDTSFPNPNKLRVDIRLYAELISTGVFTLKEGLPLLGNILTSLVHMDKETHAHISIILSFCKHCGSDYADLVPRKIRILSDKYTYELPTSNLLPLGKQKNVKQMLKDYFSSVCQHLIKDQVELRSLENTNKRIMMTKGEVHTERIEKAEKASSNFNKLLLNAESLADILDEDLPIFEVSDDKDLNEDYEEGKIVDGEIFNMIGSKGDGNDLWEDEDTRSFYEDLMDLKSLIPAILYKDSSSANVEAPKDVIEDVEDDISAIDEIEVEAPVEIEEEPDEDGSVQNISNKMMLNSFLANIPTCINREMIDNAAVEFCMSLNTKKNRLKLVKTLFGVHRNRQDLFPFYARLVATLSPCMPEVSIGLGQYLKQEFRWQLRKKDQMKIESKLKVVRFIGELVKFKMFPKCEALFCMKQLIFDFSHHHIEMACTLMETAGRYLYRMPESHQRTKIYLEQMMRKKQAVMSSDSRYSMMIENAFYTVCPPENTASNTQVKLPPLHAYIRKLIFNDFNETNASRILKQIRKINWNSEEEADYAIQCLSQVWNLKFYNIRNFAGLLAGLVSYHDWIAPRIIDGVLENIRVGMEINDSKYNQRRLAVITFLGELYVFHLVDSSVVFKVLYSLITFGCDDPLLDPPDHMFRIRLVCTLLDTCGPYFTSLSSKKKLDYFFSYFQRYYWKKRSYYEDDLAFPFFIKNLIIETLPSVRPDTKLYQNYEEACAAVDKIEKDMVNFVKEKAPDFAKEYLGVVVEETSVGPTGLVSISEEQEYEDKAKDTKHNRGENSVIDDDDLDDMIDEEEDETGSRDSQDEEEEDFSQLPEEMSQEEEDDEEDIDDEDFDDDEDNEEKFIKDEVKSLAF